MINQPMGALQQLHADRTAELRSIRRPRREHQRRFTIPRLVPGLGGWPVPRHQPIGNAPVGS